MSKINKKKLDSVSRYSVEITPKSPPTDSVGQKGPCGSFVECKTGFDPNFAKPSSRHRVDQFGSKWICK